MGGDSCKLRDALTAKNITSCGPSTPNPIAHANSDKELSGRRGCVEIMFGKLKEWGRLPRL